MFAFNITNGVILKTMKKRAAVKHEQELSSMTITEAFNRNSVTPDTKTKGEGLGTAVGGALMILITSYLHLTLMTTMKWSSMRL